MTRLGRLSVPSLASRCWRPARRAPPRLRRHVPQPTATVAPTIGADAARSTTPATPRRRRPLDHADHADHAGHAAAARPGRRPATGARSRPPSASPPSGSSAGRPALRGVDRRRAGHAPSRTAGGQRHRTGRREAPDRAASAATRSRRTATPRPPRSSGCPSSLTAISSTSTPVASATPTGHPAPGRRRSGRRRPWPSSGRPCPGVPVPPDRGVSSCSRRAPRRRTTPRATGGPTRLHNPEHRIDKIGVLVATAAPSASG